MANKKINGSLEITGQVQFDSTLSDGFMWVQEQI